MTMTRCGKRRQKCRWCDRPATKLCDYPKGRGTCSKLMCNAHAVQPAGTSDIDYCPHHADQAELAL